VKFCLVEVIGALIKEIKILRGVSFEGGLWNYLSNGNWRRRKELKKKRNKRRVELGNNSNKGNLG
jgi:hypothetical protein